MWWWDYDNKLASSGSRHHDGVRNKETYWGLCLGKMKGEGKGTGRKVCHLWKMKDWVVAAKCNEALRKFQELTGLQWEDWPQKSTILEMSRQPYSVTGWGCFGKSCSGFKCFSGSSGAISYRLSAHSIPHNYLTSSSLRKIQMAHLHGCHWKFLMIVK